MNPEQLEREKGSGRKNKTNIEPATQRREIKDGKRGTVQPVAKTR